MGPCKLTTFNNLLSVCASYVNNSDSELVCAPGFSPCVNGVAVKTTSSSAAATHKTTTATTPLPCTDAPECASLVAS